MSAVNRSKVSLIGISASDYMEARGYVSEEVYRLADYVEYGGFAAPRDDPGMVRYLQHFPDRPIGRHLVTTELPMNLDLGREAEVIKADLDGVQCDYMVTDFCFWRLGGRSVDSLWFRPLTLKREATKRISENTLYIQDATGRPFFVENPPYVYVPTDVDLGEFLHDLADLGCDVCLDVGHFVGWCHNGGVELESAFSRLPFTAIRQCHVAGLSPVSYLDRFLYIDNHNVPPNTITMNLLGRLIDLAPNLQRITYEAELAGTDVQLAGLRKLGRG